MILCTAIWQPSVWLKTKISTYFPVALTMKDTCDTFLIGFGSRPHSLRTLSEFLQCRLDVPWEFLYSNIILTRFVRINPEKKRIIHFCLFLSFVDRDSRYVGLHRQIKFTSTSEFHQKKKKIERSEENCLPSFILVLQFWTDNSYHKNTLRRTRTLSQLHQISTWPINPGEIMCVIEFHGRKSHGLQGFSSARNLILSNCLKPISIRAMLFQSAD